MSNLIEQPRYSCALGAQQTVIAIPRAIPIIHAGPGCASKVTRFEVHGGGYQPEGYAGGSNISCTNSCERDVVFGGEKKLKDVIDGTLKVMDGDLYVVLSGCTSDIIGDDTIGVAKSFEEEGYPVVGTETAGFKGTSYNGHEIVTKAIIEQFVGTVTPKAQKGLVNLFAVVPYQDPFWRGDLKEIKSLLERIGLKVNVFFGNESEGIIEWKNIPNAEFNLLVSPWVGLNIVKLLQRKYKTPFLHYKTLPVGAEETSKFLREVAEFANLEKQLVENIIQKEEKRFYNYFSALGTFITEYTIFPYEIYVVADSEYAVGVSNFLINELGLTPKGIYIVDNVKEQYQEKIKESIIAEDFNLDNVIKFTPDGGLIQKDIRNKAGNSKNAIILGSGWEKYLAEEINSYFLHLSLPLNETVILNKTYVGYNGGINLIEDICGSIFNKRTGTATFSVEVNKKNIQVI